MFVNMAAGSRNPRDFENDMAERVAKLSRGQLDCLLLVDQHLSSKEIAAELKISPHTVDQRIRFALQALGVPADDDLGGGPTSVPLSAWRRWTTSPIGIGRRARRAGIR